jgi:hypothetical protein
MGFERGLLFEQIKLLREVTEEPKPSDYWGVFLDRLAATIGSLSYAMRAPIEAKDPQQTRAALVVYVGASYPAARDYLINHWHMPREQVEAYPTAQVVFLAAVRFYEEWRDHTFKWAGVPYWQASANPQWRDADTNLAEAAVEAGFCSMPATLLLPAVLSVMSAEARCGEHIAMLQTVEAIRMHGALHEGQLPASLEDLPVPAPNNPATGKPVDYQLLDDRAVLTGNTYPGIQYRLVVKFASR